MKASELQKKYPDMWSNIKEHIAHDLVAIKDEIGVPDSAVETIAHNATFRAVQEHHIFVGGMSDSMRALHKSPLGNPLKHPLQVCLKELMFGRPAEAQKFLGNVIEFLDGSGEDIGDVMFIQKDAFDRLTKAKD